MMTSGGDKSKQTNRQFLVSMQISSIFRDTFFEIFSLTKELIHEIKINITIAIVRKSKIVAVYR